MGRPPALSNLVYFVTLYPTLMIPFSSCGKLNMPMTFSMPHATMVKFCLYKSALVTPCSLSGSVTATD